MKLTSIAIGAAALVLSACGGGGDSGTPTAQTQTVNGTAATGAAMAGATVTATCSSGSGRATTKTDGTYSVPVSGASLPCVLTATSSDGKTVLHTVVPGSGSISSSPTANVTPLTELLVAQLAGQDPAKYVAAFSSTTTVSATDVSTAQSALVKVLQSAGFDASSISDFIGGTISAGSGQGYDGVLDKLQSTLTSAGATLADLSTAVASTNGSSSAAGGSTLGTVLAPANSACPALKSGDHRLIKFSDGSAQVVTINASATPPTVAMGGSSYQLTQGATACDFSLNDTSSTRVLVAKSGMAVWTSGSGSTGTLSLSMPKQTMDPSAVNGGYNFTALSGSAQGQFGTHNYSKGVTTAATNCSVDSSCTPDTKTPYGHLVATSDGGADWVDDGNGGTVDFHAYGFQNAQGNIIWIAAMMPPGTGTSGYGLGVFAPQTTLAMPATGTVNAFWQRTVSASGLSAVSEDSNTITAVSGSTVTRTFADNHTDQVTYNTPFNGMRHRAANACTNTAGTATTCREVWQLPLGGLTLAWYGSLSVAPNTYQVNVSVAKPAS